MFLQRYSIVVRISFVVGVVLTLMLTLAFVEVRGLNSIRSSMDEIVGKHYQRLQMAQDMRFLARDGAVLVRNVLLVEGEAAKKKEVERFEESTRQYIELQEQLQRKVETREERAIMAEVIDGGELTFGLWRTIVMDDGSSDPHEGMQILQAEVRSHQWGLLEDLDRLVQVEKELAEHTMSSAIENYRDTKSMMGFVYILAVSVGLFLIAGITGSIVRPLKRIMKSVDAIAAGDLSTRVRLQQNDEIGQLANHINKMAEKLNRNEEELDEYRYNLEELIELRTGQMNEQRERFISVLIHDLKGPLVPIAGFSRLLMKGNDLDKEKEALYIRQIYESTSKLAAAIEHTSRNLREKRLSVSFDKEPFDMEDLLYAVSRNCQPSFVAEGIELSINGLNVDHCKSSGDLLYSGDANKFRSLMENLLGNAGKYAQSKIDVYLTKDKHRVRFIVDDDGIGVAKPFRKKIFEEYYQAPGSKNGTGVGLYSVKRIVEHYQGKVSVDSSILGGARFTISLPLT